MRSKVTLQSDDKVNAHFDRNHVKIQVKSHFEFENLECNRYPCLTLDCSCVSRLSPGTRQSRGPTHRLINARVFDKDGMWFQAWVGLRPSEGCEEEG